MNLSINSTLVLASIEISFIHEEHMLLIKLSSDFTAMDTTGNISSAIIASICTTICFLKYKSNLKEINSFVQECHNIRVQGQNCVESINIIGKRAKTFAALTLFASISYACLWYFGMEEMHLGGY